MNVFVIAYVESSTDGMSLFSTFQVFKTHDEAVEYICQDDCAGDLTPYIDYVNGEMRDYDGEISTDLPDCYNDGSECIGYWIIEEQEL